MNSKGSPLDPESLTELALHDDAGSLRDVCAESDLSELAELKAFVSACREAAAAGTADSTLADQMLSVAQSEDLSWRGDLRLLGGFVRDGLRSSALLRLAAASLLLHIAAVPVLAFFVFTGEPALPEFRVELGDRELPYALPDSSHSDDRSEVEVVEQEALNTLLVENTLRWSRWQVSITEHLREEVSLGAPVWLLERAGILWGSARDEGLAPLEISNHTSAAFIRAESALDEFLTLGPAAREKSKLALRDVLQFVGSPEAPATWLALSSIARAESYGVVHPEAAEVLKLARSSMPAGHRYRALLEVDGDLRRRMPIDPLWVAALAELDPTSTPGAWLESFEEITELGAR